MACGPSNDYMIFCTPDNLIRLGFASVICMDACPSLFSQLFTIHAFEDDKHVPLVYCLMARKDAATYKAIFQTLIDKAVAGA